MTERIANFPQTRLILIVSYLRIIISSTFSYKTFYLRIFHRICQKNIR